MLSGGFGFRLKNDALSECSREQDLEWMLHCNVKRLTAPAEVSKANFSHLSD